MDQKKKKKLSEIMENRIKVDRIPDKQEMREIIQKAIAEEYYRKHILGEAEKDDWNMSDNMLCLSPRMI